MARPGQAANRKRKREIEAEVEANAKGGATVVANADADAEGGEEESAGPVGKSQVLPIGELPEDFEGDPEDGATYLALAT
jgi:hypothetical protein